MNIDTNPFVTIVVFVGVLVPSVILHEVSHGVIALAFGDDTAKRAGRITLNPVPHIDPFGSIILPALLALSSFGAFGWARPVPVNPYRLRKPRQQALYVALAGPATNVVLAITSIVVFKALPSKPDFLFLGDSEMSAAEVVYIFGLVNILLAVFNLLPIPPLDGSAIIERFLPRSAWPSWHKFRQYAFGILLVIVLLAPGALRRVFDPAVDFWRDLL